MEITLHARIAVDVWQTVEVNSLEEVENVLERFEENDTYFSGTREINDSHGRRFVEYECVDVLESTEIEEGYGGFCGDLFDYAEHVNNDPNHPLHDADADEQRDGTDDAASIDDVDMPYAEAATESHITQTANTAKVIRIPQPPKITRRNGLAAIKNGFKRLFR